jgi:microcystin degradation protein MlrC
VHHYPHDDMWDRGREAVLAVPRIRSGEWRPVIHVERLPLLVPTCTTYSGLGAEVLSLCQELEATPGVLDCTFMHGFPYTDNELVGAQVVVTTNGDAELARAVAQDAARLVWARREEFVVRHPHPAEAVARALGSPYRPVVINETSDNPGGGAPCDGTHLLRALLGARPENAVFVGLRDPSVVQQAVEAGVGATLEVELGGKTDALHGQPVRCRAEVLLLTDGDLRLEAPMGAGTLTRLGRTALDLRPHAAAAARDRPAGLFDRLPEVLAPLQVGLAGPRG